MKNINDILEALKIPKDKYSSEHAGKLAAIYTFFEKEKKNIISAVKVPTEPLFFAGRVKVETKYDGDKVRTVINEGAKMAAERFIVIIQTGRYEVTVPTGNRVYEAFCSLLDLQFEKTEPTESALQSFELSANQVKSIQKGLAFISRDDLRPAMSSICIEIKDGK